MRPCTRVMYYPSSRIFDRAEKSGYWRVERTDGGIQWRKTSGGHRSCYRARMANRPIVEVQGG